MVTFNELKKGFDIVSKSNKRLKTAYERFINSTDYELYDCYKSFSINKERAFDYCYNMKTSYDGNNGRIITYNKTMFTYGFLCVVEHTLYFCYITKCYNIAVPVYCLANEAVQI